MQGERPSLDGGGQIAAVSRPYCSGMAPRRPKKPKLVMASLRLFEEDVRELRRRDDAELVAKGSSEGWQVKARVLLHEALQPKRKAVVV